MAKIEFDPGRRSVIQYLFACTVAPFIAACGNIQLPPKQPGPENPTESAKALAPSGKIEAGDVYADTQKGPIPQYWYTPIIGGNRFEKSGEKTPTPVPQIIPATDQGSWSIPEKYFDNQIVVGGKDYKTGGKLPAGEYDFYPLVALQTVASPADFIANEGSGNDWTNVFETTQTGLAFAGIAIARVSLAGALVSHTVTGGLQRQIEGESIILITDAAGKPRYIKLDEALARTKINFSTADNASAQTNMDIVVPNNFPPKDWRPHSRKPEDNCGVNLDEYYSLLFLDQVFNAAMMNNFHRLPTGGIGGIDAAIKITAEELPSFKDFDQMEKRKKELDRRLKEGGCYFFPEGGSVFMDYKHGWYRGALRAGKYSKYDFSSEDYTAMPPNSEFGSAFRNGMNYFDNCITKEMTTEQALEAAKQLILKFWW